MSKQSVVIVALAVMLTAPMFAEGAQEQEEVRLVLWHQEQPPQRGCPIQRGGSGV